MMQLKIDENRAGPPLASGRRTGLTPPRWCPPNARFHSADPNTCSMPDASSPSHDPPNGSHAAEHRRPTVLSVGQVRSARPPVPAVRQHAGKIL